MKSSFMTGYLFAFLLHLSSYDFVNALRCYQCSSIDEYSCGEFFDTSTTNAELAECKLSNAQYCIKTTGIFDGQLGAKRFCSERFLDNYCTYVQRPGDQREYRSCVYTCTIDGCNGSTNLSPFSWITLTSLALVSATYLVTFNKI